MVAPLDLDQLKTFIAIAETGSFTKAADQVFKTQSAVSMQMRRLEERISQPIFVKDGRINRLTDDGERLLCYARKMLKLNDETICAFTGEQLEGSIRFGTADDYAERFMPSIIAQFSKSNPNVELNILCEPSPELLRKMNDNELDVALVTHENPNYPSELVRTEPLYWVTSLNHMVHEDEVLPVAMGREDCCWRQLAEGSLQDMKRDYHLLVASHSATVVSAAVLAGIAVAPLPECALQYGMRILTEKDGFASLGMTQIGIMTRPGAPKPLVAALKEHIVASLDNMTPNGPQGKLAPITDDLNLPTDIITEVAGCNIKW